MGSSIPAGGAAPEPPEPREFDPVQILETLDRHGVSYIMIGGLAATLHGSPTVTVDVDLAAEQSQENLGRLAAALTELDAEAAGRGKDAVQLPLRYALRDELRTRPDRGAEEPEPPR